MNNKIFANILILISFMLSGCFLFKGEKLAVQVTILKKKELKATLSSVNVANNQITITGSGFSNISVVKLQGNGIDADLSVYSKSNTQIIAKATSALSLLVNGTFNLIIGTVEAQAIYPIIFTLQNGAIQAVHLSQMGASSGQVLKWNGSTWGPASLANSQIYLGNWNAASGLPDITALGSFQNGDYLIVTTAGTYSSSALVHDPTTFATGDWIMFNGSKWDRIDNTSNVVGSFQGRKGAVVLVPADYVSLKDGTTHKVTGSSLNDLADIDLSVSPTNGQILKWNASVNKWEASDDIASGGAGSISTTELANGAVTYAKMTINDGELPIAKLAGTSDATKYLRGDKSWQALTTDAVTEGSTNLYFSNSRVLGLALTGFSATNSAITATDSVLTAFGKTQGQINSKLDAATFIDWSVSGIQTIDPSRLNLGSTNQAIVTDGSGAVVTSGTTATELGYVSGVTSPIQAQINSKLSTPTATSAITAGSVQTNLQNGLSVNPYGTSAGNTGEVRFYELAANGANYTSFKSPNNLAADIVYVLPATTPTAGQVLSTDATGVMSWMTLPASSVTSVNSQTGAVVLTTDNIAEGSNNLYHTNARSLATTITAPTLTNSAIATSDTIQVALGKLQAQSNAKESSLAAGTTSQYYRGDKTWQALTTDAVTEGSTNLYFSNSRVLGLALTGFSASNSAITATDSVLTAFGKTQGQIDSLTSIGANYLLKNASDSVTGQVTINAATGSLKIPTTPSGIDLTDAANVQYVNTYADLKLPLAGGALTGDLQANAKIKFQDGSTNTAALKAPASIASSYVLTLPTGLGSANQVLTTDANGILSWTTPATTATPSGSASGDLSGSYPSPTLKTAVITDSHIATTLSQSKITNLVSDLASKVTSTLTSGKLFIGNSSNVATGVALSGDATISNSGALTLNTVGVDKGGTGLTSGTSGGIPYYSSNSAMTSSGVLASNGVMLGGGAGVAPSTTTAGSSNQVLRVPAAGGAPAFGSIDLSTTAAVGTSVLPIANGGTGAANASANAFFAGPSSGIPNSPSFRAIASTDLPSGTISGSGTANYVPYYSAATTLANSPIAVSGSNVGIGTTSPNTTLTVAGDVRMTGANSIYFGASGSSAGSIGVTDASWGPIYLSSSNGVVISNSLRMANSNITSNEDLAVGPINNNRLLTLRSSGTGNIVLSPGGAEKIRIDSSGNVGIGTTTPASKLHIGTDPTASANYGTLSIGGGAFDGSTTGKFVGSSSGTQLAVNTSSGFSGNLMDLQVQGVSKLNVNSSGRMLLGSALGVNSIVGSNGATDGTSGTFSLNFGNASYTFSPSGASGIDIYPSVGISYPAYIRNTRATDSATTRGVVVGTTSALSNATSRVFEVTNASTNLLTVTGPGNVGVGTIAPAYKLDVVGDINTSTCFRIGATTVSGTCTSDARLKENIQDFNPGLKELLGIRLRTYQFNGLGEMPKTGETAVGVIAQEVEKTNPSLVKTRKVLMHPNDQEKTEIKVVDYSKFTYMLINAVKELYSEIKVLMARLLSVEEKVGVNERSIASVKEDTGKLKRENAAKDKEINELKIKAKKAEDENALIKSYLCAKDSKAAFCK